MKEKLKEMTKSYKYISKESVEERVKEMKKSVKKLEDKMSNSEKKFWRKVGILEAEDDENG